VSRVCAKATTKGENKRGVETRKGARRELKIKMGDGGVDPAMMRRKGKGRKDERMEG